MKILVTGDQGFIAPHVIQALKNTGHEVDSFDWHNRHHGVMDYNWVIHVGANSSTTERNIDLVLRQNLEYSIELFNQCKTFGINFQYSSSASVYGLNQNFNESCNPDPRSPYAWSKYLFDRYVEQHRGGNIVQGFRYFNVYGQGEIHKGSQASPVTQFRSQARKTGKIKLFDNSENYCRDFVCVEDVVDSHLKFLNTSVSGVFNIGTGTTRSFERIARLVAEQESAEIEYIPMPPILTSTYQEYTQADLTQYNLAVGAKQWTTVEDWMKLNYDL
jgi:ADP-L-glycero-D-manno-heptose 6-epimerase